jgi:hypothetical protein
MVGIMRIITIIQLCIYALLGYLFIDLGLQVNTLKSNLKECNEAVSTITAYTDSVLGGGK